MRLHPGAAEWQWYAAQILPRHWERLAVVYGRQAPMPPGLEPQASTRLHYGWVRRAVAWGWPEARVLGSDDELGRSGPSAEGRPGLQRLVAEVGLDHVGLMLGVAMARLARSSHDWPQALERWALLGTLSADLDGIYEPRPYNDRVLVGLKGTLRAAELHRLTQRMSQGTVQKARRGARSGARPLGSVHHASGEGGDDPDEHGPHVVRLLSCKLDALGTLPALLCSLGQHDIQLGGRLRAGPATGTREWRRPNRRTLPNMLQHPL